MKQAIKTTSVAALIFATFSSVAAQPQQAQVQQDDAINKLLTEMTLNHEKPCPTFPVC